MTNMVGLDAIRLQNCQCTLNQKRLRLKYVVMCEYC
jgi:hypothetical protein